MDEQVNIPALLLISDGRTYFVILNEIWLCSLIVIRVIPGKSGIIKPELSQEVWLWSYQLRCSKYQEKSLGLS